MFLTKVKGHRCSNILETLFSYVEVSARYARVASWNECTPTRLSGNPSEAHHERSYGLAPCL